MGTLLAPVFVDHLDIEKHVCLPSMRYDTNSTTTTLNGTLTLTVDSYTNQVLSGSAAGYSVVLPDATTLLVMWHFIIINDTNQTVAIKDNGGNVLYTLSQKSFIYIYLNDISTANGIWLSWQVLMSSVASGVISYNITSTTAFTTSSATDVIITGLTVTPQAGTYAIWYNATATCTQNNSSVKHSIYRAGTVVSDSVRTTQSVSANFIFQQSTQSIVQFNGTQTCDIRVSTNQGSHTVNGRSLLLIRLGT